METKSSSDLTSAINENNLLLKKSMQLKWIFIRGLINGLGTVIGGTLLIALALWILSQAVVVPYFGNAAAQIIKYTNATKQALPVPSPTSR